MEETKQRRPTRESPEITETHLASPLLNNYIFVAPPENRQRLLKRYYKRPTLLAANVAPPENRQRLLKLIRRRSRNPVQIVAPPENRQRLLKRLPLTSRLPRVIGRPTRESPEITETFLKNMVIRFYYKSPHQRIARDY